MLYNYIVKNNRKRGFNHMKIIPLIDEIINTFNETTEKNLNFPFFYQRELSLEISQG